MAYLLDYLKWKGLYEAANGEIPSSDLAAIPVLPKESGEKHTLNPIAAEAYSKMVAAAKADGIEWGITDSYRPLEVQKRLAKEKGLYSQGGLAAEPGTSNHGWGSAVDLDFKAGSGDAALRWLKNNAARFGFTNIPREPWHWEHKESAKSMKSGETASTAAKDQIPQKTNDEKLTVAVDQLMKKPATLNILKHKDLAKYMADVDKSEFANGLGISTKDIDSWSSGKISDRDFILQAVKRSLGIMDQPSNLEPVKTGKKLIKSGSTGEEVTEIQKKLKEKGFFTKEPNGTFDADTDKAVREFQTSASIKVDGIVGPETYAKLYGEEDSPTVTSGQLTHSYTGEKAANINLLIKTMEENGITNPYSQAGMLAVIGKETGFIPKNENMNYSKERLPEVWGVFSKTGNMVPKGLGSVNYNDLAVEYANQPEKLANFVYGQKPNGMRDNAYGNTSPGDGWKYRGRGFNGITFKSNYEKYAKATGLDLVNNPDQLNDPKIAAKVAVLYFINVLKTQGIDLNSFTSTEEAAKIYAKANAGWGSPQNVQDWAYASAAKIIPNFTIKPTSSLA